MLNQFRATNIVWDKASLKLYAAIRASSSDENGRKLVVQVINKGVTENLENTSLSLYWEQGETKGLDSFNLIDAKNGIFEIYYTTEMLSHIGQLKAYLYLIDAVGAVTSEPFGLTVFKGIDTDAIQSDNSISTLTQAIIDVNNLKSDIAVIKSEEEERVSNENERKTAETARVTAETTRNTNETTRVSNETDRVNAEDTRNTNETNRVDAETSRVTAETARVAAEEEREQGYPALDGRITAVEQNLDLTKIRFYNSGALIAAYNTMRDREVRVVYSWNVTKAQGWPQDRSTGNACLLVKVSNDYGLAIANSGEIGQWYSDSKFLWR